jgi:hypothetical protein
MRKGEEKSISNVVKSLFLELLAKHVSDSDPIVGCDDLAGKWTLYQVHNPLKSPGNHQAECRMNANPTSDYLRVCWLPQPNPVLEYLYYLNRGKGF